MDSVQITKKEIENKLNSVGDYVKIDFLSQCLKKHLDFDTKKFVQIKLSALYEQRGMPSEAAKLMNHTAEINTTYQGKINDYVKACELYIRAGKFDEADECFNKALFCGNERQKVEMKINRKEFYKKEAAENLKRDKRKHAMVYYEKLLSLDLMPDEKKMAQMMLLELYNKLGKVREYINLKKQIG